MFPEFGGFVFPSCCLPSPPGVGGPASRRAARAKHVAFVVRQRLGIQQRVAAANGSFSMNGNLGLVFEGVVPDEEEKSPTSPSGT